MRTSVIRFASLTVATILGACAFEAAENTEPPSQESATPEQGEAQVSDPTAVDGDGETPDLVATPEAEPVAELEAAPEDVAAVAQAPVKRDSKAMPSRRTRIHKKGKAKSGRHGPGGMGGMGIAASPQPAFNTESYSHIAENEFTAVADDPRSTFSIDVDTASYSNVRRFLSDGSLPPADAVRVEEMINYFTYRYARPEGPDPFSVNTEIARSPWSDNVLVHVGLQGKVLDQRKVPARNLVFLMDVSGSMNSPDKLPLLKRAMGLLVENMRKTDKVSMVVYAGASGVVLEPTSNQDQILKALEQLEAGGSTNGGAGIELAYRMAEKAFIRGGINRVILATDGDFNVGVSSQGDLVRMIEKKRKSGVFLSVFGFGSGNLKDSTMELLADKGNGNYAYIDTIGEARKVLVEEAGATLVTIAKDVKLQVEFNPAEVDSYRLIGYENRKLAHTDFNDDTKDAGEIGAGHSVTAIYEVVPAGLGEGGKTDGLKYQKGKGLSAAAENGELMTVNIRYKQPRGSRSKLLSVPVKGEVKGFSQASNDFRFAAAVSSFGMLLRGSKHAGKASFQSVFRHAKGALGRDPGAHRRGFLALVKQAARIKGEKLGRGSDLVLAK